MADVGLNTRSLHAAAIAGGSVGDFIALMKTRVLSLGVFTAFTGMGLPFGVVLSIGSVLTLGLLVNWVAGALLALTIAFYVFVYTMWLKRRTPQNIVIGGGAGGCTRA